MLQKIKKFSPFGLFCLFFLVPVMVQAEKLPQLVKCRTVRECLLYAIGQMKSVVIGLTVVVIIIAGIIYLFSGANIEWAEKAKRTLIGATLGFAIILGADILISQIGCALGWKGAENCPEAKNIITRMIKFLFSILGAIGMIGIIIGAITYMTAAGNEQQIKNGRKMVIYAIVGTAIALSAVVIVRQVEKIFL